MKMKKVHAVDLFCGVGGLSFGLKKAGINVCAGIDLDEKCEYPYEANIGAPFIRKDVRELKSPEVLALFPRTGFKLLAGCAPCQPFSRHMRGADTSQDAKWSLLDEFSRLVRGVKPDFVTMENVVGLASTKVFQRFVSELKALHYFVDWKSCYAPRYGLAQHRRRLVLLASKLGPINAPKENTTKDKFKSVRDVIGKLPPVAAGEAHPKDSLHKARSLTPINKARLMASTPGGTWLDWPEDLRAPCHKKATGASFQSVYARMSWDEPSPTITTQAYNFGTGRFGHPAQDRAITLREAAMLQGFPKSYKFVMPREGVQLMPLGRLIGNAVPPPLGKAIGSELLGHVRSL